MHEVDPILQPDQRRQHPACLDIRVGQVDDRDPTPELEGEGPRRAAQAAADIEHRHPRFQTAHGRQPACEGESAAVELIERRELLHGERTEIEPRRDQRLADRGAQPRALPAARGRLGPSCGRSHDVPAAADVDGPRFDRPHPRRGGSRRRASPAQPSPVAAGAGASGHQRSASRAPRPARDGRNGPIRTVRIRRRDRARHVGHRDLQRRQADRSADRVGLLAAGRSIGRRSTRRHRVSCSIRNGGRSGPSSRGCRQPPSDDRSVRAPALTLDGRRQPGAARVQSGDVVIDVVGRDGPGREPAAGIQRSHRRRADPRVLGESRSKTPINSRYVSPSQTSRLNVPSAS